MEGGGNGVEEIILGKYDYKITLTILEGDVGFSRSRFFARN